MGTAFFGRSVTLMLALAVCLAGNVFGQVSDDPVNRNGSFEETDPGTVTNRDVRGWVLEVGQSVPIAPEFAIVEIPDAPDGDQALRVTVKEIGSNAWDVQAVADSLHVEPGETYRFSVWARAEEQFAQASFTVGNYAFNEYGRIGGQMLSTEWTEYTFDFTITDNNNVIRAPIHFNYDGNIDNPVYIDHLRIVRISGDNGVPDPTGPPLAEGHEKFLGNVYAHAQLPFFEMYWNQVTPENASKWGSVQSTRDTWNWAQLDAAYALAKDNDQPFRFHVLVWGNQQPTWMTDLSGNPAEQLQAIEEWFQAVADRYPDIDYLEVVNEPLHDPPDCSHPNNQGANCPGSGDYIEALGGKGDTGWDWVITAFEMARDIFPESTNLMINEYNILSNDTNVDRYLDIIELLQDRGLIDGIGVQGHAFSTRGSAEAIIGRLDRLAETGLPIQVTEMDIDGNPNQIDLTPEQSDAIQLSAMQRVFPALWEHPAVEGITMWGWRPGMWRTPQEAFLVRENGEERPAMVWLREYLAGTDTSTEPTELVRDFLLHANYPNPFNPTTQITYELGSSSEVRLDVVDVLGRHVRTLVSGHQAAGHYSIRFEAGDLPSGVYLYRLETGNQSQTRRMMLVK